MNNHFINQLLAGEVIAYPTEAVFGLGCDPFNPTAVDKLLKLKQRSIDQGLILVAADPLAFADLVDLNNQAWLQQILTSWQDKTQAITWLIPAKTNCPAWLTGKFESQAVRVSHHPIVREICQKMPAGLLVSTSANPHGEPAAINCEQVKNYFPELECWPAEIGGLTNPSQIWDSKTKQRIR